MPIHRDDASSLQLYMSENSLKYFIQAYDDINLTKVDFDVEPFYLKGVFQHWDEAFGDEEDYDTSPPKVRVQFRATWGKGDYAPNIDITQSGFEGEGTGQIIIYNPLNSEIPAAIFNLTVNASIDVMLEKDFLLTGKSKRLNYTLTGYQALFDTPETIDVMKSKIEGMKKFVEEATDIALMKGVDLPVPARVRTNISSSKLTTYNSYLLFEANQVKPLAPLTDQTII